MRNELDASRLRRYLLGSATAAESEAVERAYFERADALDGVAAAEDELIDDYLSGRLAPEGRERFDRHYLGTPTHRRRVEVARAIRAAGAAAPPVKQFHSAGRWWTSAGFVAASLVVVAGLAWMLAPRGATMITAIDPRPTAVAPAGAQPSRRLEPREPADAGQRPGAPAVPPVAAPAVVALSISPILVRGADEPASLTIGPGTGIVRVLLRGTDGEPVLNRGRAIVRTVGGREIWRGATGTARPALARVDIPAARLRPDDYIVELRGTDAAGVEVERHRYFLRVRAP